MVEGVVRSCILGQNHVDRRVAIALWCPPVGYLGCSESLSPILRRLDHPALARGSDKRYGITSQCLVSLIELDARVHHLLLAKSRQLIGAKRVLVVVEERIWSREVLPAGVHLGNGLVVCGSL